MAGRRGDLLHSVPPPNQWYLSYDGRQMGPPTQSEAMSQAAREPNGRCWRQGFAEWIPIASCTELCAESAPGQMTVPPPPIAGASRSDQFDYRIIGEDMQFVEVELDPGESAVAEAGTLMYKDSAVRMETVVGDGSAALAGGGLYFQKEVMTALFGGEGVFLATLTGPGKVWIQSLPFSRLAGRMCSAASNRGGRRDEGSVLGGLGGLISGDRGF